MTGTELATLINIKTKTGSGTFSAADMLIFVNLFKDEIAGLIQQKRPEIFNMPTNEDLVASSTKREYAFPADVLNNIVRLDLKFTSSGKYVWAEPYRQSKFRKGFQESIIVDNFTNTTPRYFIRRQAIYILSGTITAVTDGILLTYNVFPANLANLTGSTDLSADPSTTTLGFPREFHELLARRVSIEYKDINDIKLSSKELKYDKELEEALNNFSRVNLDKQIIAELPAASKRGNNGQDY